jgi:glycosidase
MSIYALDSADVKKVLRRDGLPEVKRWLELNTDGFRVDVQKAATT